MIDFRVKNHSVRPGVKIVEVWADDVFVATITPGDPTGQMTIRVISKHLQRAWKMDGLAIVTFALNMPSRQ